MKPEEGNISPIVAIMESYLSQYEPAPESDPLLILKTTEKIESELQDMVEAKEGEVATIMINAGYRVIFSMTSGQHGWAMRYRR